jgi:hypothetical protein
MPKKSTISKLDKIATQSTEVNNPLVVNPNRQAEIIAECDRQGLTLAHLVQTVYDGTKALRTTVDKWGEEHIEPDTAARLKAASLGFDLRGETNSKLNVGTQNNIVAIIETMDSSVKDRLAEWKRNNVSDV